MKNEARKQRRKQRKKIKRRRKKRALNAEEIGSRLDEMRALLYDEASPATWQRLCQLVEKWPDDDTLTLGLDYADNHLRYWPVHLRGGCGIDIQWLTRYLDGQKEPRTRLVKLGTLRDEHLTPSRLNTLFASPLLSQLNGLALRSRTHSSLIIEHLAKAQLTHLASLDLSGCRLLDDQLMRVLKPERLPQLRALNLRQNHMGSTGLGTCLRSGLFKGLTDLHIGHTAIGIRGLRELVEHPFLRQIERLDLSGLDTVMRKLDLEALLPSDQDMAFEALDLSENRLDNHICDVLAMASVPRLDTLRMTHNRITGVGVQAFARRPWPALRHLDLTHNQISIGGLRALLDSGAMPHLQSLRLADNPLDADITRSLIHHAQPGIKRLSAGFEPGRRQTTAGELVTMLRIHDLPEKTRVIALRKLRRLDRNQARALIVALVRGNRDNPLQGVLLEWVSGNLDLMLVTDLKALLRALGVRGYSSLRKAQLQALLIGRLRDMAGA